MKKGFTILEILLVMAVAGVLTGLLVPVLFSYQANNDLYLVDSTVKQSLRQAQHQARFGVNDDDWGVYLTEGSITVFKGNDYASRDSDFDNVIEVAPNINMDGLEEVYFAKQTGLPDTTGTITLSVFDDSFDIIINSQGGIE